MVKMSYCAEYTDVVADTAYYTDWHDVGEDVRTIELATNVSFIRPSGEVANVDHKDMGNKAIAFHGTSGVQIGWLASQADMLSGDWIVID